MFDIVIFDILGDLRGSLKTHDIFSLSADKLTHNTDKNNIESL